jgi:hypothetical protein
MTVEKAFRRPAVLPPAPPGDCFSRASPPTHPPPARGTGLFTRNAGNAHQQPPSPLRLLSLVTATRETLPRRRVNLLQTQCLALLLEDFERSGGPGAKTIPLVFSPDRRAAAMEARICLNGLRGFRERKERIGKEDFTKSAWSFQKIIRVDRRSVSR